MLTTHKIGNRLTFTYSYDLNGEPLPVQPDVIVVDKPQPVESYAVCLSGSPSPNNGSPGGTEDGNKTERVQYYQDDGEYLDGDSDFVFPPCRYVGDLGEVGFRDDDPNLYRHVHDSPPPDDAR